MIRNVKKKRKKEALIGASALNYLIQLRTRKLKQVRFFIRYRILLEHLRYFEGFEVMPTTGLRSESVQR